MTSDTGRAKDLPCKPLTGSAARALAALALLYASVAFDARAADTCTPALARVVSLQGDVELRKSGADWKPAELDAALCAGDAIRVRQRARAALLLANETTVRLDQGTELAVSPPDPRKATLLEQLGGAIHVISRTPQPYRVRTPFVNANVEGTEFLVQVDADRARVAVFEGRVVADNDAGSVTVMSGEQAVAVRGAAPTKETLVRPREAVQWTLYFPTLIDAQAANALSGTAAEPALQDALRLYRERRLSDALSRLDTIAADARSARVLTFRAALLLAVGRLDEARPQIERAISLDARNADALALQSIIAVVENDTARALERANAAVAIDPRSPAAWIALSYAQQARFDIEPARDSVRKAIELDGRNALARARLAELEMSLGDLDAAVADATRAVEIDPRSAKARSVLGFASLARIDTAAARTAFQEAIAFDDADPLPRLGLGLAMIRDGDLQGGREQIEVALSLDPERALIRSYVGKAYYEERREDLAAAQFGIAKSLDPNDPTSWFYDAILKESQNRPVEALDDVRKSIELNNNRAVYRSRLLLDEDQAARTVTEARIYTDIGFDQLALNAGTDSLAADPTNSAAHRLLADTYVDLPRRNIARVSELLQSQLRQPLTMTPTQMQLAEERFVVLRGAGPTAAGFNEFNTLFNRNGLGLQGSAIVGGNSTAGDELLVSGIHGRWGYSIGQLAYHTDGFRENNDSKNSIYDAFVQYEANELFSVQAEIRRSKWTFGDPVLRFDPQLFLPDRNRQDFTSYRIGARYRFSPRSELVASAIALDSGVTNGQFGNTIIDQDFKTYIGEVQHTWRDRLFDIVTGVGAYSEKNHTAFFGEVFESTPRASTIYTYGTVRPFGDALSILVGVSFDHLDATDQLGGSKNQTNPKVGLTWAITSSTVLRVASFRTLKRRFFANQTLEPTEVAGFNQFFDDQNGTDARGAGAALEQRFSDRLFAGIDVERRFLKIPQDFTTNEVFDWREHEGSAYVYWAPHDRVALSGRYKYERFERPPEFPGVEFFTEVTTHTMPLRLDFHHPAGFIARATATRVNQHGMFYSSSGSPDPEPGSSRFWVVDAALGYRFPKRLGMVTAEVKNLFDKSFQYQETDPLTPAFARHRVFFLRAAFAF